MRQMRRPILCLAVLALVVSLPAAATVFDVKLKIVQIKFLVFNVLGFFDLFDIFFRLFRFGLDDFQTACFTHFFLKPLLSPCNRIKVFIK